MKRKDSFTDKELENILTGYFNRTLQEKFTAKLQPKEEKHMKKTAVIKYGTIGVCTAALLAVGIFSGQITDILTHGPADGGTSSVLTAKQNSFTITAYANETATADNPATADEASKNSADYKPETGFLGGHFVEVIEHEEYVGTDGYIVDKETYDGEYTTVSVYDIGVISDYLKFRIEGDNIVSYSAVCQNGQLDYSTGVMVSLRDEIGTSSNCDKVYHYNIGSSESSDEIYANVEHVSGDTGIKDTGSIAFASSEECKTDSNLNTITWTPSSENIWQDLQKYADEISMYDDEKGITAENRIKYGEYIKQYVDNLNSSTDIYNDMFADTIAITVNYADGTSEEQQVHVTFNENSQYVVDISDGNTNNEVNTDNLNDQISAKPTDNQNSFTITAYNHENGMDPGIKIHSDGIYELMGGVELSIQKRYFLDDGNDTLLEGDELDAYIESGETQYNGYNVIVQEDPELTQGCIIIDVQGKNIDHYSVTAGNGDIFSNDIILYDLENIPYDEFKSHNSILEWCSSAQIYFQEIRNGKTTYDKVTVKDCQERMEAVKEKLQTADDYTGMFGDTITITAYYKDGSSETKTAVITLDENGNYYLDVRN